MSHIGLWDNFTLTIEYIPKMLSKAYSTFASAKLSHIHDQRCIDGGSDNGILRISQVEQGCDINSVKGSPALFHSKVFSL